MATRIWALLSCGSAVFPGCTMRKNLCGMLQSGNALEIGIRHYFHTWRAFFNSTTPEKHPAWGQEFSESDYCNENALKQVPLKSLKFTACYTSLGSHWEGDLSGEVFSAIRELFREIWMIICSISALTASSISPNWQLRIPFWNLFWAPEDILKQLRKIYAWAVSLCSAIPRVSQVAKKVQTQVLDRTPQNSNVWVMWWIRDKKRATDELNIFMPL